MKKPIGKKRITAGVQWDYVCQKNWSELKPTSDTKVRFCESCKKNVHLAESGTGFQALAVEGKCVAYKPESTVGVPRRSDRDGLDAASAFTDSELSGEAKERLSQIRESREEYLRSFLDEDESE